MTLLVVKVGGGVGVNLDAVCADVAALVASGQPVVFVHGTRPPPMRWRRRPVCRCGS